MFDDFVQSALRRKTKRTISFSDLPTLLDELRDAQHAAYPDADMGKVGGQLEEAFSFSCPSCGGLKSSAVLMGAMIKSMQGMNPGMATVFGGPNIANLAGGRCPGCSGTRLDLAFDPHALEGITPLADDGKGTPQSKCFVATACYGTPNAPEVEVLRGFRDDVLVQSALGRSLVTLYYRFSPRVAGHLRQHAVLRRAVRELLLRPAVMFARVLGADRAKQANTKHKEATE